MILTKVSLYCDGASFGWDCPTKGLVVAESRDKDEIEEYAKARGWQLNWTCHLCAVCKDNEKNIYNKNPQ